MKEIIIGSVLILVILNQIMTLKFTCGFLTGAYMGSKYNLGPYFNTLENNIKSTDAFKDISGTVKPIVRKFKKDMDNGILKFLEKNIS